MGCCNKEVNDLLNYSKKMIDQINLCKEIPCPDELRKLEYLTFAGLYYFYGVEHFNEVFQAFLGTEFIYCKDNVSDVLRKYTNHSPDEIEMLSSPNTPGFFYFDFDSDGIMRRKIFVFENEEHSYGEILECIVHEVNHAVNSVNNVLVEHDDYISVRTGLSTAIFCDGENFFEDKKALEEVYNQLQTIDIVDHIFDFSQYDIEDSDIKESFDHLKSDHPYGYTCKGYVSLRSILRPLYDDDNFNLIVRENRLEGSLDKIEEAFDSRTGDGAYKLLGEYFDALNSGDWFNYYVTKPVTDVLIKQYVLNKN